MYMQMGGWCLTTGGAKVLVCSLLLLLLGKVMECMLHLAELTTQQYRIFTTPG